jgi:hypothetical protein
LYALAAVLAGIASVLQLIERDWFRGITGLLITATMAVAATGFPDRSAGNRRIYFVMLGVVVVLLIIQIARRLV